MIVNCDKEKRVSISFIQSFNLIFYKRDDTWMKKFFFNGTTEGWYILNQ